MKRYRAILGLVRALESSRCAQRRVRRGGCSMNQEYRMHKATLKGNAYATMLLPWRRWGCRGENTIDDAGKRKRSTPVRSGWCGGRNIDNSGRRDKEGWLHVGQLIKRNSSTYLVRLQPKWLTPLWHNVFVRVLVYGTSTRRNAVVRAVLAAAYIPRESR